MVKLYSIALVGLTVSSSVFAMPLTKRVAQVISASTAKWEQACRAANGGQQCNPISVTAFSTLLANAGPCDQQDSADAMIDLGKQLNSQQMITLAQIFSQQPRNSPNSVSIPYCQKAPKNAELNGLFQCQFAGVNPTTFVGGVAVGGAGTIPFGRSAPVSPAGSCPAHPQGPVPDGQQLSDIVQSPGTPSGNGGGAPPAPPAPSAPPAAGNDNAEGDDGFDDCDDDDTPTQAPPAPPAPSTTAPAPSTPTMGNGNTGGGGSGSNFVLQNGKDAQAENARFATLTANSSCTAGENACVNGGFAQCVGGKFVVTQCAGGLVCASLPLVLKPGTSIACTTQADALDRISRTGATGGITG